MILSEHERAKRWRESHGLSLAQLADLTISSGFYTKYGMKRTPKLTHEQVRNKLDYNPFTGELFWRWSKQRPDRVGKRAGSVLKQSNRRVVHIEGESIYAGPLIWFYMTGRWPVGEIDHRNRDGVDDRWCNLREATPSQNCANRRLPTKYANNVKGVYQLGPSWVAHIKINGRMKHLGCFDTQQEAVAAFRAAQRHLYGEFAHAYST